MSAANIVAWSTSMSTALEASRVVKASAGGFRSAVVRLDSTAGTGTFYILLLNHASLPGDGAVTMLAGPIKRIHTTGTDDYITYDFTDNTIYASTGIVIALSTTEFTLTIAQSYITSMSLYR